MTSLELIDIADHIIGKAEERGITLRLYGSLGIWHHCKASCCRATERGCRDIDVVGRLADKAVIVDILRELGFRANAVVQTVPGYRRGIFEKVKGSSCIRCDVCYDYLEFCHTIDVRDRIHVDSPTIPLAELLLSKLQIREQTTHDIWDIQNLLAEHGVGVTDDDEINGNAFGSLCANDWGLYHTVLENLGRVRSATTAAGSLGEDVTMNVERRVDDLIAIVECRRKSWRFRLRAMVGERLCWYRDVEEINEI